MTTHGKRIYEWLTFDMIVFIVLFIGVTVYLDDGLYRIVSIGTFELIILGLAAYRLANIVSTERITKPLRAPFVDEVVKDGEVVEQPKRDGFLGATGFLLHCPSCTGVWVAAILVYAFLFWPVTTFFFAVILALSGIERIISNVSNWFRKDI